MKHGLSLTDFAREIERRANAKEDLVANTNHMQLVPTDKGVRLTVGAEKAYGVNSIAHAQIATQTEIPKPYYDKMLQDNPELLANNVNTWFKQSPAVRMVRTLDGGARAFPSDKYKPLENEDLAAAVLPSIRDLGLDVMSCELTERRM